VTVLSDEETSYCYDVKQLSIYVGGEGWPEYTDHVRVFPTIIHFGEVEVGSGFTTFLRVENTSNTSIELDIEAPDNQVFDILPSIKPFCSLLHVLEVGQMCRYRVNFAPEAAVEYSESITISFGEPADVDVTVQMDGEGI